MTLECHDCLSMVLMLREMHAATDVPQDVSEIVTQIKLLVDYMRHCPTRVMAAQVMDVCMLTLLRTKEMMMIRGKFTVESTEYAGLIHAVLEIFDELVAQNRSDVLDDALLALLVEDQDVRVTVLYTKNL